ncbi:exonuclease (macronuclear) [Tetrahymena thermophila SB210]|uniref:Exonuclease n=1 Tax=Tetrahymena thermophila (strain SB210) TaxID=312017 RepID=Q230Z9_TETTS|nr:exonuclease [Tetrahymena thermophila SB210]EAR91140.2 exonuclease [Tetrahymena thermophila SB210]|eukprot:XP_001011385.2 exonuclease [Tetrahymena thermophila SB210]
MEQNNSLSQFLKVDQTTLPKTVIDNKCNQNIFNLIPEPSSLFQVNQIQSQQNQNSQPIPSLDQFYNKQLQQAIQFQIQNYLKKSQYNQKMGKFNHSQNFQAQRGKGFRFQDQEQTNGINISQKNNELNILSKQSSQKEQFQKTRDKKNQLTLDKKLKKLEVLQEQQMILNQFQQQQMEKLKLIYQQLNHIQAQKLSKSTEINFEIQQNSTTINTAAPTDSDDQQNYQNSTKQEGEQIQNSSSLLDQTNEKNQDQINDQQEQKSDEEEAKNENKDKAAAEEIRQSDLGQKQSEQEQSFQQDEQNNLDKQRKFVQANLMQKNAKESDYDYLFFIDYECNQSYLGSEIIEFPIQVVDVKQLKIIDTFSSYVQPCSKITKLITNLTKIDDNKVQNAPKIQQVLQQVRIFLEKYLKNNFDRCAVVYDNKSDFLFIVEESIKKNFLLPAFLQQYIDLGTCFPIRNEQNINEQRISLKGMLDTLGMKFQGQKHCGADDCKNQALVAIELLKRGYSFTKDLQVNDLEQVITNYFKRTEKQFAKKLSKLKNKIQTTYKKE